MLSTKSILSQPSRGRVLLGRVLPTTRGLKTTGPLRRRKLQPKPARTEKDLEYPYGLNPVDYAKPPPMAPTLVPPPPKRGAQPWLIMGSITAFVGFGVFLYFNSDSETYEYWKRVETGENIMGDDDDDDDYDEDDDE